MAGAELLLTMTTGLPVSWHACTMSAEPGVELRKGVRDRGARCDEIGEHQPGTASAVEGTAEPVRIRFAYIDEDQIHTMCSLYEPGDHATGLRLVHGDHHDQEDEESTRVEEASA